MQTKFGIVPTDRLKTCVLDALGRAGHLQQAEDFFMENFDKDSIVPWRALLGFSFVTRFIGC